MDEALEAYRRAIATQPTARAYAWLGAVHFYMGRPDEAIRAYEMARDLNPADPMGWGNLGGGLRWWPGHEAAAREPLERAVTLMRRHLDENGRDAQGWSHLANWLGHLGRLDEAKRSIELAIELAPQDAIALQRAAYVHHLRGERAPAIARLKEAIARGYSALKLAREPSLAGLVEDPEVARMFARSTAGKKTLPLEMKLNPGGEA
jgi:Flp pilus assembly protein TadD